MDGLSPGHIRHILGIGLQSGPTTALSVIVIRITFGAAFLTVTAGLTGGTRIGRRAVSLGGDERVSRALHSH